MHQPEGSVDSEVRPYGTPAVAQPCNEETQQCARHVAASPCGGLLCISQRLRRRVSTTHHHHHTISPTLVHASTFSYTVKMSPARRVFSLRAKSTLFPACSGFSLRKKPNTYSGGYPHAAENMRIF